MGASRREDREVEPLYSAFEPDETPARRGPRLLWRLLVAALVLAGLVAVVLNQAF